MHACAHAPFETAPVRDARGRKRATVVAAEAHQHEARTLCARIRADQGARAVRFDS